MKNLEKSDVPKHLKVSKKKLFSVVWHFTGDKNKLTPLGMRLLRDFKQNYETEKAANQAMTDWLAGRGNMKYVCPVSLWEAKIQEK